MSVSLFGFISVNKTLQYVNKFFLFLKVIRAITDRYD